MVYNNLRKAKEAAEMKPNITLNPDKEVVKSDMEFKKGTAIHTMQFFSADIPYKDFLKDFKTE